MPNPRKTIPGSERPAPPGRVTGALDPNERLEVSLYVKDAAPPDGTSRADLRQARTQRLAPSFADVTAFAKEHGLDVTLQDYGRRLVKLAGPVARLEAAFATKLHHVEDAGQHFRARTGTLSAPSHLSDRIEAVLGLDNRPAATSKIVFPRTPKTAAGYWPNEIAALYAFPKTSGHGHGQCIALIELGGGYNDADTKAAFAAMKLTPPAVVAVPVSGGSNSPGSDADGEVALDIQVAGGAAPGAAISVYFAPNTDQGFVDAITTAIHDETNAPSVMSISWGSAENGWTQQAITSMSSAFADAAALKVSVFAASGDSLASDGVDDGALHVDFPASSPLVVGCGGTRIAASGGKIASETVWNSEGSGTGGGISALFALPNYQSGAKVPVSPTTKKPGRGVPDVAADADPNSGYQIVLNGEQQVIGGTSAVAPLWAGLFALVNEAAGAPVGQPHATLYAHTAACRDIVQGDNRAGDLGYTAGPGWDACTGLGAPVGTAMLALFAGAET